jgi:hypothetical protein
MKPLIYLFFAGIVIGTVGYIGTMFGAGDLIPPSGFGWLEVPGIIIVIPTAILLKLKLEKHPN